jgi:phospholipid transport system substrate-binding protein
MYLERLEAAAHQRLQDKPVIRYDEEQLKGQRATVRTTVITKRSRQIPLEYHLRQSEGQWRVYDVIVMGVSLVSNYRAQCQRIIAQSSYRGLVELLRARQLGAVFAEP